MELNILLKCGSLTPSHILRYFTEDSFFQVANKKEPWTFIILGCGGPTGKTWLCTGLKQYGFRAFEVTESIYTLVDYKDNGNHVIQNDENRTIVIVLNHSLKGEV